MWVNFEKFEVRELQEPDLDRVVNTATEELKGIKKQLEQGVSKSTTEELESAIWANALTVSMSFNSFISSFGLAKPVAWIRKKLEDWLKKYVPALRQAIKALAGALRALSYSISVGFPFNISASISWSPSTP